MLERQVERHLRERVGHFGGLCLKFVSPGRRNVPDRLVLLPRRPVIFCELKALGKKPRPGQIREHERLRKLGYAVEVVDSFEGVEHLLARAALLPEMRLKS